MTFISTDFCHSLWQNLEPSGDSECDGVPESPAVCPSRMAPGPVLLNVRPG